jgi:pyruvate-formate lyase
MTDEVKAAVTQIFSVNQTDKGQGHIIIDYPRLLNKGLAALAAEMKSLARQHPENDFYQAVLILLAASQRHILRYATLAAEMAAAATRSDARSWRPSPLIRAITPRIARKISGRPASCSGI